jgi:hypothetical protein
MLTKMVGVHQTLQAGRVTYYDQRFRSPKSGSNRRPAAYKAQTSDPHPPLQSSDQGVVHAGVLMVVSTPGHPLEFDSCRSSCIRAIKVGLSIGGSESGGRRQLPHSPRLRRTFPRRSIRRRAVPMGRLRPGRPLGVEVAACGYRVVALWPAWFLLWSCSDLRAEQVSTFCSRGPSSVTCRS